MSFCHPFQKIVNLTRFLSFSDFAQSRPLSNQKRLKMFTVHINLNVFSFLWNCLWENFATINLFGSILITMMHYMRMSTMKLLPMSIIVIFPSKKCFMHNIFSNSKLKNKSWMNLKYVLVITKICLQQDNHFR